MKQNFRRAHKKRLRIWMIVVACAVLVGAGLVIYHKVHNDSNSTDSTATTLSQLNKQSEAQDKAPKSGQSSSGSSTSSSTGGSSKGSSGSDTSTTPSIGVVINRVSQPGSGQDVQIRATISGVTSGTCSAKFTQDGQSDVEESAPIDFEATAASCGAFNVPATDFPSDGSWHLSLTTSSGGAVSPTITYPESVTVTR